MFLFIIIRVVTMADMFYELPVFLALFLIIIVGSIFAMFGRLAYKRYLFDANTELNSFIYVILVLVWFSLVGLSAYKSNDIKHMNDLLIEEANQAKVFFYDLQLINNDKTRERLKMSTIEYINNMADLEHKYLILGSDCVECTQAFNSMSQAIYDFLPGEQNSQQWANNRIMESILKLDNLRKLRLSHLTQFNSGFSIAVVSFLYIIVMFLAGVFRGSSRSGMNFVGMLTILLFSGAFWFYLELDRPFNNIFSIDDSQFGVVRQEIQRSFFYSHDLDGNPTQDELKPQSATLD